MSKLKVDQLEEVTGGANVTINTGSDLIVDDNIQLGHDSDTTLARASAGDISVEGNTVYRAGGTDVAVADGGTGAGTATAGFDALSPMTTAGDIMYGGSSGTGTRLAASTDGHVLTATGAGSAPAWEESAGKILQVVTDTGPTNFSSTSTSLVQVTDSDISITPTSASSRIILHWQITPHINTTTVPGTSLVMQLQAYRGTTSLGIIDNGRVNYPASTSASFYKDQGKTLTWVDHPNTTSAVTYWLYGKVSDGTFYAHHAIYGSPKMKIMAMEVSGLTTEWSGID